MSLRKYSIYIGLLILVSTISLMSYGVFTLIERPFEFPLLFSFIVLGLIHGGLALGFAYFNKGFGLIIYFLGYIGGFILLLIRLSTPNEGFLHLASLFEAFVVLIIAVIFAIVVEFILWMTNRKKKPA